MEMHVDLTRVLSCIRAHGLVRCQVIFTDGFGGAYSQIGKMVGCPSALIFKNRAIFRDDEYSQQTLIVLAGLFHNRQCADPRDTIYGLLGMASDCRDGTIHIEPDYSKSLFAVYMELMQVYRSQPRPWSQH